MMNRYEKMKQLLIRNNLPGYRHDQILQAIFKQRIGEYDNMINLPQRLREELIKEFGNTVYRLVPVSESKSEQAGKVLFALADGNKMEAVRLRYQRGWESFCISSQSGCGFGCRFCATGAIGFKRNLTADEITDQLLYFYLNGHSLDSISFMGMGEALANPNLFDALALLTDPALFGLSQRRITISTIGMIPGIHRLTAEFPQVNLAFSLHSPFEKQRSALMPVNQKYSLHEVMEELDHHVKSTGRKVFIAYILLDGINDSPEHAAALARLLKSRVSCKHLYHVDLIPYNATDKTAQRFAASGRRQVRVFGEKLKAEGIGVTVRAQFGSNIDAACGQLYGEMISDK